SLAVADGKLVLTDSDGNSVEAPMDDINKASNGLHIETDDENTSGAIKLGGELTKKTTIVTDATNTLAIAGLQNGSIVNNGTVTNKIVVVDEYGILKQVKAAMPRFFYMPSIAIPTDVRGIPSTIELYEIYEEQFGTPMAQNPGATALPVLNADQLNYYITYYDTNVFEDVSINNLGVMTFTVKADADLTVHSFMNIVFEVKP
ncbi:collagen, type VII, alpha, partial [Parapedobacter luteus]